MSLQLSTRIEVLTQTYLSSFSVMASTRRGGEIHRVHIFYNVKWDHFTSLLAHSAKQDQKTVLENRRI